MDNITLSIPEINMPKKKEWLTPILQVINKDSIESGTANVAEASLGLLS
jgi:hypothetical protein